MESSTTSYEGLISYTVSCSLCFNEQLQTEAKVYCKECLRFLCEQCEIQHDRFPTMTNHLREAVADMSDQTHRKVVDSSDREDEDVPEGKVEALEKCRQHPECLINMFCEDHTSQCCGRCAFEFHKDCKSVITDLLKESRHIVKSQSYKENIYTMRDHLKQLQRIEEKRRQEYDKSKAERAKVGQEIEDIYDELIDKINRMKACTIEEMNEQFTTQQKLLTDKLRQITNITNTVDRYLEQIDDLNMDEVSCYIKYRKGKEFAVNLTRVIQGSRLEFTWNSVTFKKNENLTKFLNDLNNLGEIQTNNPQPVATNLVKMVKPISSPYKYPWLPVGGVFH